MEFYRKTVQIYENLRKENQSDAGKKANSRVRNYGPKKPANQFKKISFF